jgi:hypothetical protein
MAAALTGYPVPHCLYLDSNASVKMNINWVYSFLRGRRHACMVVSFAHMLRFGMIWFRMGRTQSSIQDRLGLLQVGSGRGALG